MRALLLALLLSVTSSAPAAALTLLREPNASQDPVFESLLGAPDEFLGFTFEKNGSAIDGDQRDGHVFSDLVTFSTGASIWGEATLLVRTTANGELADGDISPYPTYIADLGGYIPQRGLLQIDFARPALGVGFSSALSGWAVMQVYGPEHALLSRFVNDLVILGGEEFGQNAAHFGLLAAADAPISRITIGGDLVIIDDFQYRLVSAPEPATWLLLGLGLVAVPVARRLRSYAA